MPKAIRNCFHKKLSFAKLFEAYKRARKNKVYKDEVIKFELNLENFLTNLENSIRTKKYHLGKYFSFKVYEPKERIINALPFVDRIVHQWYIEEFIKPFIVPKFIPTSFACLKNKGTHKAVYQVQKYMRIYQRQENNFWVLKCDIAKFFYSIDPHILFKIMQKYIKDKDLLDLTKTLIFDGKTNNNEPRHSYWKLYFPILC